MVSGRIARPIAALSDLSGRVAAGDLAVEPIVLQRRDEIGGLATGFSRMVQDLRDIIRQVQQKPRS